MTALFNYIDFYLPCSTRFGVSITYTIYNTVLKHKWIVKTTIEGQSRQQNIREVQDTNGAEEDINNRGRSNQPQPLRMV
jgi:hypothetical protein